MSRPRICIAGSILGGAEGVPISAGQTLAAQLRGEGYAVTTTSNHLNKMVRAADLAAHLMRERNRFDVAVVMVFSGNAFGYADLVSRVLRLLRKPTVAWLHGGNLPTWSAAHPRWTRQVLGRADLIVAPSPYLQQAIGDEFDVRVVPNSLPNIDGTFRRRSRAAPRLLWMRSFSDVYNPTMALDVFAEVLAARPDATMTMAGSDGGRLESIIRLARERGLGDVISFPGFLDSEGKRAAFEAHDVFLNTNVVDNTPVTVLEAAAAGLPIIATCVGGIPFLLTDEETALLVRDGDVGAMAAAVLRVVNDHDLSRRLSQGGRALVETFEWDNVFPLWETAFDDAIGQRRPS